MLDRPYSEILDPPLHAINLVIVQVIIRWLGFDTQMKFNPWLLRW